MCMYIHLSCIYDETCVEVMIHEMYVVSSYSQIWAINL